MSNSPNMRVLLRHGTVAEWTAKNPILAKGELGLDTSANWFKIGDGVTAWATLPYIQYAIPPVAGELDYYLRVDNAGVAIWATDNPLAVKGLSATGVVKNFVGVGGGWKDILGVPVPPNAGPTIPTWTQMGASVFYAPLFAINNTLWFNFHIPHDYSPGTDVFAHVHWTSDGVDVNTVKWEWIYTYAKGHNQASFNIAAPTTITVEEAGQGSAWRHMITETAAISDPNFEPDGILKARVRRITNGGVNNANNIFMEYADLHYQAGEVGITTKNRTPNFYT